MQKKRILLLSPYHGDSHRYWAKRLINHIHDYEWTLLTLPARHFSWRLRGNPMSMLLEHESALAESYDAVLCTSMLDVATCKGLLPHLANIPWLVYFHENQFAYPQSPNQKFTMADAQILSIYNVMAADYCLFNSEYNRHSFALGAAYLLGKMPEKTLDVHRLIEEKTAVLGLPVELNQPALNMTEANKLVLTWAARWEHDKGFDDLLDVIDALIAQQVNVKINILGQSPKKYPERLETLLERHPEYFLYIGYAQSLEDYQTILSSSDIFLSTARHEFFGIAAMESVNAGCFPLLPNRLVYPEIYHPQCLYASNDDLVARIKALALGEEVVHSKLTFNDTYQHAGIDQYKAVLAKFV